MRSKRNGNGKCGCLMWERGRERRWGRWFSRDFGTVWEGVYECVKREKVRVEMK